MTDRPRISVVVETINARFGSVTRSLIDEVEPTLAALALQTYPADDMETILVVDDDASFAAASEVVRRHPVLRVVRSRRANYFEAKNAGAAAARGEIVAFADSDCLPSPRWVQALVAQIDGGAAAAAGESRYPPDTLAARVFSIFDLAHVIGECDGATGLNLSNVAFRRDVLLAHPLETRIERNGGCYLLYKQLRAEGLRVAYAADAKLTHGYDIRGMFGFARKHFARGSDGVAVYRLDETAVLAATHAFRRLGAAALPPIFVRRVVVDWQRLLGHRRQLGIPLVSLPFFALLAVLLRGIELAGALFAVLRPAPVALESQSAA